LHLEPGSVFVGIGVWHPDSKTLLKIRNALVGSPDKWTGVLNDRPFSEAFSLGGDSLKRAPRGFDPDHSLIEDLKRKDFVAFRPLKQEETYGKFFLDRLTKICSNGKPFIGFLADALGLNY
jgi:uncharacterized protein (TIGR02453 family)